MSETELIAVQSQDDATILRLKPVELDILGADHLYADVVATAEASPDLPVVLDLADVSVVNSHALSIFVELHSQLERTGQRFVLVAPSEFVRKTLAVTRLDTLITVVETTDAALTTLSA